MTKSPYGKFDDSTFDRAAISSIMERFKLFNIKHHQTPNSIKMWPNECECFLWCAMNAPDGDWLEIGSFCGGPAVLLNLFKNHNGKIHCVDIEFSNVFYHNIHTTGRFYDTVLHKCDSSNLKKHYISVNNIGFAFIDGYHSYKQVLKDFIEIEPFLVDGAIIAFHDVSPDMWNEEHRLKLIGWSEEYNKYKLECGLDDEDFRLDEAVAQILDTKREWEWLDTPVKNEETHFEETHLKEWERGKTSPFTSLCAIRKTK